MHTAATAMSVGTTIRDSVEGYLTRIVMLPIVSTEAGRAACVHRSCHRTLATYAPRVAETSRERGLVLWPAPLLREPDKPALRAAQRIPVVLFRIPLGGHFHGDCLLYRLPHYLSPGDIPGKQPGITSLSGSPERATEGGIGSGTGNCGVTGSWLVLILILLALPARMPLLACLWAVADTLWARASGTLPYQALVCRA